MLPELYHQNPEKFLTPEFQDKIKQFKKDWYEKLHEIAKEKTPELDGNGKQIIKPKGDTGYNYIEETYMRDCLDRNFPGWSLTMAAPLHWLGAEWVVAQIYLDIIDEHLIPFGIVPPIRKFYGVDSVRIQYGQGKAHLPENLVDVGDNCKQAVSAAMKVAINRITRIGDDVYGKRIEFEGSGSPYDVFIANPNASNFMRLVNKMGILMSSVYKVLKIQKADEIQNFKEAYDKLIEYKKGGGK